MAKDYFVRNEYEENESEFISELPISLLKENLKVQFSCPLEYRKKDNLSKFIGMYNSSIDTMDVYEDEEKDKIEEMKDDFWTFLRELFYQYLGIGFVDFDDKSFEDQCDLATFTYKFFISDIKKNFLNIVLSYIDNNRDSFEYSDTRKDVTSMTFKKELSDPTDVYIISNLGEIIDKAINDIEDVDDFFNKCESYTISDELDQLKKYYENFEVTGNFVDKYCSLIDDDFKSSLESKIRNKILNKYRKK